jgi:hypothetical protein
MIFEYLKDLDSIKCNLEILKNFKSSLTNHLLGSCKTGLMVAKEIVCTLASMSSSRGVAKTLGVERRNIKRLGRWV